jgi:hypothetical protein
MNENDVTHPSLDALGPVDYVVVGLPPGASSFTGEHGDGKLVLTRGDGLRCG